RPPCCPDNITRLPSCAGQEEYPITGRAGHKAALRKVRPSGRIVRMSLNQRGHAMRSFDFAPFYRSTVGFDRLFSMLDQVGGVEASAPSYPPYNIARTGERRSARYCRVDS